jgi:three-Cys-motif partner protein
MSDRNSDGAADSLTLFPVAEFATGKPMRFRPLSAPLWTASKAALIARYLHYFVLVTRHGTYIDLFAGPQTGENESSWTAELVLKNEPAWLNRFHLFEQDPVKVQQLEKLRGRNRGRGISVNPGDCNTEFRSLFRPGSIKAKTAAFCLLDQRTFECEWRTVEHVATLKTGGYKVEQFYFLAQGWLNRSFAALGEVGEKKAEDWWGNASWRELPAMDGQRRAELLAGRFKDELGYKHAQPWPIFKTGQGRSVMYYMIHATDHDDAPPLMRRAYEWAVAPVFEDQDQLAIDFAQVHLS